MNIKYNRWREQNLFECLDSLQFECIHCGVVVKHPFWHYIKYYKYVRQLPLTRAKRWLRNAYVGMYNRWFDSITRWKLNKMRKSINKVIDERIRQLSPKNRKETAWQELLRIEAEMLVCVEVEG
jgi:hypothetical protein